MEKGVPIRSVSRSIAVLQLINRRGTVALVEIARAVRLPYPTACRIVQTLVHEGLVECEPTRKHYRTTSLVQSLSLGYRDHGNLIQAAKAHTSNLTKKIGWPTAITTSVGQSVMLRDSTYALTSLSFSQYYPGYTFPILECAAGNVHIAYADDDTRESILSSMEEIGTVSSVLDMFKSGKLTRRIRQDGFASRDRTLHTMNPGKTSSIAVPIMQYGAEVGELTLSFFASAMPMNEAIKRYVDELQATASAISASMDEIDAAVPQLPALQLVTLAG